MNISVIYLSWRYKTMWFCCGLTEMGSSAVKQQIQIAPSSSSAERAEWKKYGSILAANTKYQIHKIQELLGQFSFWTRRPILNLSSGVPGQNWVRSNWNIYIYTYWTGIDSKWKRHTWSASWLMANWNNSIWVTDKLSVTQIELIIRNLPVQFGGDLKSQTKREIIDFLHASEAKKYQSIE